SLCLSGAAGNVEMPLPLRGSWKCGEAFASPGQPEMWRCLCPSGAAGNVEMPLPLRGRRKSGI
ncbi:hypothetical protein P0Y35_14345, partial [Kiritimatiellaeota bacterium B1221]|nr:hypothetical protein [Kiritimatiellaeota bacterium B1221]